MLPPPRPTLADDPLFAIRTAAGVTLAVALADFLGTVPPMIVPALMVSLLAGQRGAFNASKVVGAAVVIVVLAWLSTEVVIVARYGMFVFITAMLAINYFAFFFLMKTGNQLGIMLVVFPNLLGLLSLDSSQSAYAMRDAFIETALISLGVIPVLYLVFPAKTRVIFAPEPYTPDVERPEMQALLRLAVLGPLLLAFYLFVDISNLIYLIIAILVLAYPERQHQRLQARERIIGTALGGFVAMAIVIVFSLTAHAAVLLCLLFLGGLWFSSRMVSGPLTANTYIVGYSVMAVLAVNSLTTSNPLEAGLERLLLTIGGAAAALTLLALLEGAFLPHRHRYVGG